MHAYGDWISCWSQNLKGHYWKGSMNLMTVSCPGEEPWAYSKKRQKGRSNYLKNQEGRELRDRIGWGVGHGWGWGRWELRSEQGRRISRRNGRLSENGLCACQACDRNAMWKNSAVEGRKLEVMLSGSKWVSGFDAPEWVVTKDCQSWDCGAARGHHSALTPLLWLPELMQGLSSIIFISVAFFKQPVADDFLASTEFILSDA